MNINIVKVEGPHGRSMYFPWDMDRFELAGQDKVDELRAMDFECRGTRPRRARAS